MQKKVIFRKSDIFSLHTNIHIHNLVVVRRSHYHHYYHQCLHNHKNHPHLLLGGCWEIPGEEATLICRTNNAFRCSQGEENNITSSRSYLDYITIHHFDYTICSGPLRPTLLIPFIITQEISRQTLGHRACLPWGSSAADITQTMLMMVCVVTMRLLKM